MWPICDYCGLSTARCRCGSAVIREVFILVVKTWESHEGGMHQETTTSVYASMPALAEEISNLDLNENDSFEVTTRTLHH